MAVRSLRVGRVLANQTDLFIEPRSGGRGKPVILACHGANGSPRDYADPTSQTGLWKLSNALADAGFLVVVPDWGGIQPWDGDSTLGVFDAYVSYVATNYPLVVTSKVLLWGESMGNTIATRLACERRSQVAAVGSNIPCSDIVDIYNSNALGVRPYIQTATGVTYPTAIPYKYDILARAQAGELAGLPWKGWNSTADTVCPPSTVSALVAAIGSTASNVVTSTTDQHGDAPISKTDTNDFVNFFNAHST